MKKHILCNLTLCLFCALWASTAQAQVASGGGYTLERSAVAGGGGTSSGDSFEISGTIGQHAAATSSGGDYTLAGGFWFGDESIIAPVCASDVTAGLSITRGSFRQNLVTRRFTQTVTIRNSGSSTVQGALALALDDLSSNAALYNPTGRTSCAAPLDSAYAAVNLGNNSALSPGGSVTVTLEFTNSTPSRSITYTPRLLSGNGNR